MPKLAAAVCRQAPGVPVIGPSFIDPANRDRLPADLPGLSNGHPYPGGGPPEPALAAAAREAERDPGPRGLVFTETGYHNALNDSANQPPASEEAAAVYFPRLLLEAFGLGARRTFIYELLDEKPDPGLTDLQQHFGLLRNDFSPKPAFAAIRTLIAAVRRSPGPGDDGRLRWTLSGDGRGGRDPADPRAARRLAGARSVAPGVGVGPRGRTPRAAHRPARHGALRPPGA